MARRRRRLEWWGVVAAGAAIVVGLGVVAVGGQGEDGATDPAAFDLPAQGGEGRVRLAGFRGTPVVVNFFASWCTAWDFEQPGFTAAADALRGKVAFVGVNALETGDWRPMAERHQLEKHGFVLARDTGGRQGSGLHAAPAVGNGEPTAGDWRRPAGQPALLPWSDGQIVPANAPHPPSSGEARSSHGRGTLSGRRPFP